MQKKEYGDLIEFIKGIKESQKRDLMFSVAEFMIFVLGYSLYCDGDDYSPTLATVLFLYIVHSYIQNEAARRTLLQQASQKQKEAILRALFLKEALKRFWQAASENKVDIMRKYLNVPREIQVERRKDPPDSFSIIGLNVGHAQWVYTQDPELGQTALHFAVRTKALSAINFLLAVDEGLYRAFKEATKEGKSIVNIQDNQGNTPFHIALLQFIADEQKDYSVLSALMNEKLPATIDISLKNEDGDTILDLVSRLSSPEIIDRLKEQSACISRGYSK